MMSDWLIRRACWETDRDQLQQVRSRVFIQEQQVPEHLEWDGEDDLASHWLATAVSGEAVGTIRVLSNGHIGRLAVLASHRGQGIGRALLTAAIGHGQQRQLFSVYLHAQTHAIGFYQRMGFSPEGPIFPDAGIPHRTMRRILVQQRELGVHAGEFAVTDYPATLQAMVEQTRQWLRVHAYRLEDADWNTPAICTALSTLARKSRHTGIQLLVRDTSNLVGRRHRLLELSRRLPSSISLRTLNEPSPSVLDNWVVADNCGLIIQSMREPEKCRGNFNNQPIARDLAEQFDQLWARSVVDPNLRELNI